MRSSSSSVRLFSSVTATSWLCGVSRQPPRVFSQKMAAVTDWLRVPHDLGSAIWMARDAQNRPPTRTILAGTARDGAEAADSPSPPKTARVQGRFLAGPVDDPQIRRADIGPPRTGLASPLHNSAHSGGPCIGLPPRGRHINRRAQLRLIPRPVSDLLQSVLPW